MLRAPFSIRSLALLFIFMLALSAPYAIADTFPPYEVIKPNVSFWVKIYSQYSTTQAIVHDARDLNIIYDVIDLKPHNAFKARKVNRLRMKKAKAKYQKLLKRLAANPNTKNKAARRVAELFGEKATANTFRTASRRVRCQIGQRDRFRAGLIRSGAYIEQIRAVFNANGLPDQLAYLPHVESSFHYKAYSKFGAAGIWQFTRSTGRRFMKVGYVLDERRDPISATHAAVALLKENYDKLGSWPLAITAYNHGAAGMARAKQKYGDYPTIFSKYRSRTFKFASRNFYSEFLAASHVASNYRTYFGDLPLDRPLPAHTVTLDGYVSFNDLCRHFKLSKEIAKSLNPALRPPVFNGQKYVPKGYTFRLPADIEIAAPELAAIPSTLLKHRQKPSRFYTVQRGDTAGRIARVHGVRLSDLILANNLSHRATIYPKQTLRIPVPGESLPPIKKKAPKKQKPVLVAKADVPKPVTEAPKSIKTEEDYPQPALASVIPTPTPRPKPLDHMKETASTDTGVPSVEIVSADVRFETTNMDSSRPTGTIQVEVEETLGHFAEWAGVRTQSIRRLNRLPFGKKLHLHQRIKIPLNKVSAQAFEEERYEFHKRLQEDFFAVYRIGELRSYRVKRGDNLWTLSLDKFDIPMWLLKSCNPEVDFAALRLQQVLMIPSIEKKAADEQEVEPDTEPENEPENELDELDTPEFPNSVL